MPIFKNRGFDHFKLKIFQGKVPRTPPPLVTGAPGGKWPNVNEDVEFQLTVNAVAIAFVEGSSVRMYEHRCEWNIASQLSGEIPSRSAVSERW